MSKLTIYRGDTTVLDINVVDAFGAPLDITTGVLLFTAKSTSRQLDEDAAISKSSETGGGISIDDGPGGVATVVISPEDTQDLYAPAELVWDLTYVAVSGAVTTLAEGQMLVKPDVTRRSSGYA